VQDDHERNCFRLAPGTLQDIELSHVSKGRKFVAEQATLTMKAVQPINDLINHNAVSTAPSTFTLYKILQQ
jgi:hypothetical protein